MSVWGGEMATSAGGDTWYSFRFKAEAKGWPSWKTDKAWEWLVRRNAGILRPSNAERDYERQIKRIRESGPEA